MFGMKMKPSAIFGMLKNFGIDVNTLLPQVENLLIEQAHKLEKEAGAELTGIISFDDDKKNLIFHLYKIDKENPDCLEVWKSFPFNELIQKIQNIQNDSTEFEIKQIEHEHEPPNWDTPADYELGVATDAGAGNDTAEPSAPATAG